MSKLYLLVGFAVGAAAGSFLTLKIVEKKYKDISDAEIESVKAEFARERQVFIDEKKYMANKAKNKEDILRYSDVISKEGYTEKTYVRNVEESTDTDEDIPYIITPSEFAEDEEEYQKISLKFYKDDGVLTDFDDEMVDDPMDMIPVDGIYDHFGEYEEDICYVRNDRLKIDYEILLVLESYEDILKEKPYLKSNEIFKSRQKTESN